MSHVTSPLHTPVLDSPVSSSSSDGRLWLLGDLCLAEGVEQCILTEPAYRPLGAIESLLSERDRLVANVECALTKCDEPTPLKYACLKANPSCCSALGRLDVANLGNNHVGDFGEAGAIDTAASLARHGVRPVGFGADLEEALRPVTIDLGGCQVAIVALCCPTTNAASYATPQSPGVAPLAVPTLQFAIESARRTADLVLAYLHWGDEQQHYPVIDQVRLGRRAIDMGADAVVGCHAHVIQSFECYKGRWIFYGLGNYLFDDVYCSSTHTDGTVETGVVRQEPRNRESLAVAFVLDRDATGPALRLDRVVAFGFGPELTPRVITMGELTVSPEALNAKTNAILRRSPRYASTWDFSWKTHYEASQFVQRYVNPPLDRDPRAGLSGLTSRAVSKACGILSGKA